MIDDEIAAAITANKAAWSFLVKQLSECARARATSWCPWRVDPMPLAQVRRSPAVRNGRRRRNSGRS